MGNVCLNGLSIVDVKTISSPANMPFLLLLDYHNVFSKTNGEPVKSINKADRVDRWR